LLVSKIDVSIDYLGTCHHLAANEYDGGTVDPRGFERLESFEIEAGIPTWRYACADALLEQRIFMAPGANTSYLRLEVLRATAPITVRLKPLVTYRDYHSQARGRQPLRTAPPPTDGDPGAGGGICSVVDTLGTPLYVMQTNIGTFTGADLWYWNFLHREERERGLDFLEDLWGPGTFTATLNAGQPLFLSASAERGLHRTGAEVLQQLEHRSRQLLAALPPASPAWVQSLAIASDQFIVRRGAANAAALNAGSVNAGSSTVIAGYPWFVDWGRDTMIALPGLTTVLGRHDIAASILRTFAKVMSGGMLPNRFADAGEALEYNTADATLWYFQAINDHLEADHDPALTAELYPLLAECVRYHEAGTRFGIHVDPVDGLLKAGEPGIQLTWMDAKQGDHVVTPRIGKPVEINALWINALAVATRLSGTLGKTADERHFEELLERASRHFDRFWNEEAGCLYDVIDVGGGTTVDASIRPNQLFAVSLPLCVLSPERQRAVVDLCARELLTSYGLRSLSPRAAAYVGQYVGDPGQRDAAYHQGTVWSWLLGPFARAHYRVYGDAARAQDFLIPIAQHLDAACLGSVSEIFDGDAPHSARGCFAQAWSVAEILRSWIYLQRHVVARQDTS